jgi:hypothetical protein
VPRCNGGALPLSLETTALLFSPCGLTAVWM